MLGVICTQKLLSQKLVARNMSVKSIKNIIEAMEAKNEANRAATNQNLKSGDGGVATSRTASTQSRQSAYGARGNQGSNSNQLLQNLIDRKQNQTRGVGGNGDYGSVRSSFKVSSNLPQQPNQRDGFISRSRNNEPPKSQYPTSGSSIRYVPPSLGVTVKDSFQKVEDGTPQRHYQDTSSQHGGAHGRSKPSHTDNRTPSSSNSNSVHKKSSPSSTTSASFAQLLATATNKSWDSKQSNGPINSSTTLGRQHSPLRPHNNSNATFARNANQSSSSGGKYGGEYGARAATSDSMFDQSPTEELDSAAAAEMTEGMYSHIRNTSHTQLCS